MNENRTTTLPTVFKKSPWLPPLMIFVVAAVLRVVFLIQFRSLPLFEIHIMDMEYFHLLATQGLPDTGFPNGPFFKAPLYPLFLKLIYAVCGVGPWAPRIIQIFLGSLTAMLTYLIAFRMFSFRTAFIAGLLVSISGTLILFDGQLLVPTLTIFLNLVAVYLLVLAWQTQRKMLYLFAGVALGLSAIARPTVLLVAAVLIIYLFWTLRRKLRRKGMAPLLLLIGLILPIAPITVRNVIESGEFVLIGTYGGINLYIGNNTQSDGVSATVPGTGLDWWHGGVMDDTRRMAESDAGRELSPAEQSTWWRKRAVGEILDNPGFFVRHLGRKLMLFLGGYELANNFDVRYLSLRIPILKYLILRKPIYWPWGILLPLGAAGMLLLTRWRPEQHFLVLFVVALVPTLLMFFVTARYRLPMIPVLAIFSAFAIDTALKKFRGLSSQRVWTAAAAFVILIVVGRLDPMGYASGSEAQGHQMMATLYEQQGDLARAEEYYLKALKADPTLPHTNNDYGLMLLGWGETKAAIRHIKRAVEYRPDEWLIRYNLGLAYRTAGRWAETATQDSIVLAMAPEMHAARTDLAYALLRLGYPDSALVQYRTLIGVEPDNFQHYFSGGLCWQILGAADSALVWYRRAQELSPEYAKTYYNLGQYWVEAKRADSARVYFQRFLELSEGDEALESQARLVLDSLSVSR